MIFPIKKSSLEPKNHFSRKKCLTIQKFIFRNKNVFRAKFSFLNQKFILEPKIHSSNRKLIFHIENKFSNKKWLFETKIHFSNPEILCTFEWNFRLKIHFLNFLWFSQKKTIAVKRNRKIFLNLFTSKSRLDMWKQFWLNKKL